MRSCHSDQKGGRCSTSARKAPSPYIAIAVHLSGPFRRRLCGSSLTWQRLRSSSISKLKAQVSCRHAGREQNKNKGALTRQEDVPYSWERMSRRALLPRRQNGRAAARLWPKRDRKSHRSQEDVQNARPDRVLPNECSIGHRQPRSVRYLLLFGSGGFVAGRYFFTERIANLESRITRRDEEIEALKTGSRKKAEEPSLIPIKGTSAIGNDAPALLGKWPDRRQPGKLSSPPRQRRG